MSRQDRRMCWSLSCANQVLTEGLNVVALEADGEVGATGLMEFNTFFMQNDQENYLHSSMTGMIVQVG